MNSPHKGQWRGALMFSLICVWINDWVNNREVGDLRRYRAHYDVTVMIHRKEHQTDGFTHSRCFNTWLALGISFINITIHVGFVILSLKPHPCWLFLFYIRLESVLHDYDDISCRLVNVLHKVFQNTLVMKIHFVNICSTLHTDLYLDAIYGKDQRYKCRTCRLEINNRHRTFRVLGTISL